MDFLIHLAELLSPLLKGLPAGALFAIMLSIQIFTMKDNKKQSVLSQERHEKTSEEIADLKETNSKEFKKIKEELDYIKNVALVQLKEEQLDNRKLTLRALITNSTLPVEYRLRSYDEYRSLGGNSWVTEYKNIYLKVGDGD